MSDTKCPTEDSGSHPGQGHFHKQTHLRNRELTHQTRVGTGRAAGRVDAERQESRPAPSPRSPQIPRHQNPTLGYQELPFSRLTPAVGMLKPQQGGSWYHLTFHPGAQAALEETWGILVEKHQIWCRSPSCILWAPTLCFLTSTSLGFLSPP